MAAGWQVWSDETDELGVGASLVVERGGAQGIIGIGCVSDPLGHCFDSETGYQIAASTSWVEQRAAQAHVVVEVLETLSPYMGSIHCFGTDQPDIEQAWRDANPELVVVLNGQGDCLGSGAFTIEGHDRPPFSGAHAVVVAGTRVHWVDPRVDPAPVLASVTVDESVQRIDPTPDCASLTIERANPK